MLLRLRRQMLDELTTSNATNTYKGSTTRAQNFPEWRRASLIRFAKIQLRGAMVKKSASASSLVAATFRLPQQRKRYRSHRSASRLGSVRWLCSARAPSGEATKYVNTANPTHTATVRRRAS